LVLFDFAVTAQSATDPSAIASDGGAVKSGDIIIWNVNKPITLQPDSSIGTAAGTKADKTCFPVNSRFNVTKVAAAAKPTNTAEPSNTAATPADTQIVTGLFSSNWVFSVLHPAHFRAIPISKEKSQPKSGSKGDTAIQETNPCGSVASTVAVEDKTYKFTSDQLDDQDFYREGFTWGGLVLPFKFYFKDKSIKSNSAVVGFAGYEGWFPGVSLSAVIAAGGGTTPSTSAPTSVSNPGTGSGTSTNGNSSNNGSTSTTSTLVTYTVATGLIMAFGDSKTVKAGLMFGRDYQGNPNSFAYENKWWMALSIGAGF